jgi:hypothetical protein
MATVRQRKAGIRFVSFRGPSSLVSCGAFSDVLGSFRMACLPVDDPQNFQYPTETTNQDISGAGEDI